MQKKTPSNTGAQTPTRRKLTPTSGTKPPSMDCPSMEGTEPSMEGIFGLIDYISCTFAYETTEEINSLTDFLGGTWIETRTGLNRYQRGMRCGGMSLWYQGHSDMGVNLQVTGAGCRELEMRTINQGWRIFIGDLLEKGGKFSRLDVALDDQSGITSIEQILECCEAGEVVSRFEAAEPRQAVSLPTGYLITSGVVFGQRTSNTMLRIYDKALEQSNKGGEHSENGPYIRFELEAKGIKAMELAKRLAAEGEGIIASVIAGIVDFKVKGTDSHRDRWKSQHWWTKFLGKTEKIHLSTAPREQSLENSIRSLDRQYGMTMAMIVRTYGDARLLKIAADGEVRLQKKEFILKSGSQRRTQAC